MDTKECSVQMRRLWNTLGGGTISEAITTHGDEPPGFGFIVTTRDGLRHVVWVLSGPHGSAPGFLSMVSEIQ